MSKGLQNKKISNVYNFLSPLRNAVCISELCINKFFRISDFHKMASIKFSMELSLYFMHDDNFPYQIDLVSKDRKLDLGHLCVELAQEASNPIFLPENFQHLTPNNSKTQLQKRRSNPVANRNPSMAKVSKSAQPVTTPQPVGNNISSSVPRPGVDSFITINKNMTTGEQTFQCTFCGVSTGFKSSIKRHVENTHLPSATVYKCQTCGATATQKSNMKKHYMKKHGMPEAAANGMLQG